MVTLFDDAPQARFLNRLLTWTLVLGIVLFLVTGPISKLSLFGILSPVDSGRSLFEILNIGGAFEFYGRLGSTILNPPQVCWWTTPADVFQAKQCQEFWDAFVARCILAMIPILITLGFFLNGFFSFRKIYERALEKAIAGQSDYAGKVLYKDSTDLFGLFYGFRVLWLELSDRKQQKVYYPVHFPKPRPGEALVAFEVGRYASFLGAPIGAFFGQNRSVAMPYTPHVAVMRGVRK